MSRLELLNGDQIATGLSTLEGWTLDAGGLSISRTFVFQNFAAAWAFMGRVAEGAERLDHHPDWSNSYNRVSITLTSHDCGGLTGLDLQLAQRIDAITHT